MPEADHQLAFSTAILDPETPTPAGLASAFGGVPTKRFDVYRNNVTVSLVNALADIFPAVSRIVGEQRFADLARRFAREHPPKSPLLFRYGHEFPAFIECFKPAASMPYLADVARLERAWLDAYHAADVAPLSTEALAAIAPEKLAAARLKRHPAATLVRSKFAAVTIFNANRDGQTGQRINAAIPESGLIARPDVDVALHGMPAGNAAFLAALMSNGTLAHAAEMGAAADEAFDLPAAIRAMLTTGAFASVEV
jgi:hypothetical protein